MRSQISRRTAIGRIGAAGAAALRFPVFAGSQAGGPDIVVTAVSRDTLRLTFANRAGPRLVEDGALAERRWPPPAAHLRPADPGRRIKVGATTLTFGRDPAGIRVEAGRRVVQQLQFDPTTGVLTFDMGTTHAVVFDSRPVELRL